MEVVEENDAPREQATASAGEADFVMGLSACDEVLRKTVAFVALPIARGAPVPGDEFQGLFAGCRSC